MAIINSLLLPSICIVKKFTSKINEEGEGPREFFLDFFCYEELGLEKKSTLFHTTREIFKYSQMRIRVCMHASIRSLEHAMLTQLTRMHTCVLSLSRALSLSPSRLLIFARSNSSPLRSIVLRNCLSLSSLSFSQSLSLSISFFDSLFVPLPTLPPSLPLPPSLSRSPFLPFSLSLPLGLPLSASLSPKPPVGMDFSGGVSEAVGS